MREYAGPIVSCAIPLACIAIAHPFANSAFNDDWSYSHVALRFAQTGRFHYSGWGSPTILFQTLWGAAWVRLFGFSFDVLRAATIPVGLSVVLLIYALGRRVGLSRSSALFASLTVGTSPLFLPLAVSFMTDVYGCLFILGCIYATIASAESTGYRTASIWLWILTISGIVGGSNRQVVWAAPFSLIPYLFWKRRGTRYWSVQAVAALLVSVAALAFVQVHFAQPYVPLQVSGDEFISHALSMTFIASALLASAALACGLVSLPVLLYVAPLWRKIGARRLTVSFLICGAATLAAAGLLGDQIGLAPFLGNILTPFGILKQAEDGLGFRPGAIPLLVRVGLTWLVLFSGSALLRLRSSRGRKIPAVPAQVFMLFAGAYSLLLVPGAFVALTYDRYVLPLFPLLIIVVLVVFESRVRRISLVAWVCLLLFAVYSVAVTHDYYSGLRARVLAADEIRHRGIPRRQISAGFAYDGWTQLQLTGNIRPLRYQEPVVWNTTDKFWFWAKTPGVSPDYVVSYWQASSLPASAILTEHFTCWLPPFRRAVVVLKRADLPKAQGIVRMSR